jgi:NAD(P)-dependent dehydrogenase (short-subunit alcohol dehydrogenase family)
VRRGALAGKVAVVTGASRGAGKGIALALGESGSESPLLAGRAVVALATDDDVAARTGRTLVVAELAAEYGFTDEDGSQPPSLRPQFEEVG